MRGRLNPRTPSKGLPSIKTHPGLGETRLRATLPEVTNTLLRPSACAREGPTHGRRRRASHRSRRTRAFYGACARRRGRSVTRGREVHVVLRRAGPGAAPAPADRAECAYDRRCDHPAAKPRAIHVARASPVACPPTPDVRVLQRVQVDRPTIRVVRPAPRTGASRAGRRHGLATFERPAHVTVGRARAPPTTIRVGETHVADREPQVVELPEDTAEIVGVLAGHDELAGTHPPSNPQWATVRSRNCERGTGHPGRQ